MQARVLCRDPDKAIGVDQHIKHGQSGQRAIAVIPMGKLPACRIKVIKPCAAGADVNAAICTDHKAADIVGVDVRRLRAAGLGKGAIVQTQLRDAAAMGDPHRAVGAGGKVENLVRGK